VGIDPPDEASPVLTTLAVIAPALLVVITAALVLPE
jgi:hypothetical protein